MPDMSQPPLNEDYRDHTPNHPPALPDPLASTPLQRDEGGFAWGWIAGAGILLLIAAAMIGGKTDNPQMANEGSGTVPGVTRSTQAPGSAPSETPSATPLPDNRSPAFAPAETTGSGSTSGSNSSRQ